MRAGEEKATLTKALKIYSGQNLAGQANEHLVTDVTQGKSRSVIRRKANKFNVTVNCKYLIRKIRSKFAVLRLLIILVIDPSCTAQISSFPENLHSACWPRVSSNFNYRHHILLRHHIRRHHHTHYHHHIRPLKTEL